ncbi:MAG TPA: hypothetical protein VK922_14675 [Gemmatimonadaceae bacterium]|nr:hypothetical protein [Gemmatimonadaceae bacterium]
MRSSAASAALLTLLAACTAAPAPTSPDASVSLMNGNAKPVSRPIRGSCSLAFNPPPQPPPPVFHQVDTGTCIIAHLGKTAFYGEQDINFFAGTQSGWRRLTSANGDELHGIHSGTSSLIGPGLVGFSATMTIVGGTGRFEGATGSLQLDGVASLAAQSTQVSMNGTITY